MGVIIADLAPKRAMTKSFLKASIARGAIVSSPFELPVLRSLLDEHYFRTVDSIGLYILIDPCVIISVK